MERLSRITEENLAFFQDFLPDSIKEAWIGDRKLWICGFVSDDTACGACVLRLERPEAQLEWIYLAEDYRGRGLGTQLIYEIMEALYDRGYSTLELYLAPGVQKDFEAILFAYSFAVAEVGEGVAWAKTGELRKIRGLETEAKSSVSLRECDDRKLAVLQNKIVESGDDLVSMPLNKEDYADELSCVWLDEEGNAGGILLVKTNEEGSLSIPLLYTVSANPLAIMDMMRFMLTQLEEAGRNPDIEISMVNTQLLEFMEQHSAIRIKRAVRADVELFYVEQIRRMTEQSWKAAVY